MRDADLLVVGGGIAGLTAAARASELGLRVIVLEQEEAERYACNGRVSGGIFHIAFHELKAPAETLVAAIRHATEGACRDDLAQALATDAGRTVDWLQAQGIRFIRGGNTWERWVLAPPRPLHGYGEWRGRGPDLLLRTLAERVLSGGGTIERDARASALRIDDAGVEIERGEGGGALCWRAGAVLLADGGFQADAELFRAHIGPHPDRVKQRGAANGRGDGLRMAIAAGAATAGMNRFYGHLLARDAMTNDALWPYPTLDALASVAIIVDRHGRRCFDEGAGGIALANQLASSDDPLGAAVIFDAAVWEGPGRESRIPVNPHLERAGGTIERASSLEELAKRLGIQGGALEATVLAYNDALAGSRLDALDPRRRADLHKPWPILRPPFMAVRLCAGITYTMGGILTDAHARALRADGSAIDRLYAAGAAAAGLEGGGTSGGYLGGLSKAAIFGLRAAEHAANFLRA